MESLKLRAEGFREGNIILDVSTRDFDEITSADIAELYGLDPNHEPKPWERKLMDGDQRTAVTDFGSEPFFTVGQCLILAQTIEFALAEDL